MIDTVEYYGGTYPEPWDLPEPSDEEMKGLTDKEIAEGFDWVGYYADEYHELFMLGEI